MAKIWIIIIVIIALAVGAYFMFMGEKSPAPGAATIIKETNTTTTSYENITERTIKLGEQNGSGESGSAVLSEKDGKVTVTLDMIGFVADIPQPAHIHAGSCPDVGAVAYPLTNVENGKSVTVLDTTFAKLDAKEPLAINVHKSVPETKTYVSCGNLGALNTSPSATPTSSASPAPSSTPSPSTSPTTSPTASSTPNPSPTASPI